LKKKAYIIRTGIDYY